MKKSWADKWVKALRSGKYKQGRERLHKVDASNHHKYCCLGVLCELAEVTKEKVGDGFQYNGMAAVLPLEVMKLTGMKDEAGDFSGEYFLTEFNDGAGGAPKKNFKEIADIIEKNWRKL